MVEIQRFVHEKKVTQRVYPRQEIAVDLKNKKISIIADRITEFGNLKAATEMTLTLSFMADTRSLRNPWGIFITKESEGGEQ